MIIEYWQLNEGVIARNKRKPDPEGSCPCLICESPVIPDKAKWVLVVDGGGVFETDPRKADEDDPGYMGWHAVGLSCAKKLRTAMRSAGLFAQYGDAIIEVGVPRDVCPAIRGNRKKKNRRTSPVHEEFQKRRDFLENLAGRIICKRNQETGTQTSVFIASESGLDVGGKRYAATCDHHGSIVGADTRSDACHLRAHPSEFCEDCCARVRAKLVGVKR